MRSTHYICARWLACASALLLSGPASAQQLAAAPPPPAAAPEPLTAPNPCTSRDTCERCVQTASCAWCLAPDHSPGARCFQPSYTPARDACPEEYVFNPDNVLSVLANRALSRGGGASAAGGGAAAGGGGGGGSSSASASWGSEVGQTQWGVQGGGGGGGGRIVQVAPQRVNLKLRAGQTYSVYMRYSQAEDYPVDLYYLMDLSRSMYDDKEKLSQLGDLLAQTMRNITSDFTLGFGSFVDKVVMPYVSTVPSKLQEPCDLCVSPYGFKHHMSLTSNTHNFSAMVKQAPVSGNLDAPEGGFDAMLQAAVCRREIGWREQARRLLVVSTDATSHFAGDGKLGGIVKPNDGLCHLDRLGRYTQSVHQDYPSVEQLNVAIRRNAINVIFAVTEGTLNVYERLAGRIEGASASRLAADSSNVVDLIRRQYEQISSTVRLRHNASADVSVRFASPCLDGAGAAPRPTDSCAGLRVGDEVGFRIDVEVLKCPENAADRYQTIQVYPVGINESMTIDLEMLCACECEKPGDKYYEAFSPRCNNLGTYRCGMCECAPGAFGRRCECSGDNVATGAGANVTAGCLPAGGGPECSGRGQCVCGRCDCDARPNDEHIYGAHCECDNFSCDRHEGRLCSGPEHGVCDCGRCRCKEGWTGASCYCQVSNATCYAPGAPLDGPPCSDHGECECGTCKCRSGPEGRYSGRYCEKCPTCLDKCQELRHCVECQMYGTGPVTNCSANCTQVPTPIEVEEVNVDDDDAKQKCTFYDDDGCRFSFAYFYDDEGHLRIIAEKEKKCPPVVYTPHVVLGVIAAIVLLGMAILLLWKFLTTIHDRREFARFEKERMMAKWDTGENPIYKQATSTFKNPTYAGKG